MTVKSHKSCSFAGAKTTIEGTPWVLLAQTGCGSMRKGCLTDHGVEKGGPEI